MAIDSQGVDRETGREIEIGTIIVTVTTIIDAKVGTAKDPSARGLVGPTHQDQGTMKKKW